MPPFCVTVKREVNGVINWANELTTEHVNTEISINFFMEDIFILIYFIVKVVVCVPAEVVSSKM